MMISNHTPPAAPSLRRREDLGAILRDALFQEFESAMNEEALLTQTKRLIRTLAEDGIPHVLVGGLALLQYIDGRNTRDIDLIFAVEDLPRIPDFTLREKNEWFGTGDCGPLRVDLLFTKNPLFAEVARNHSAPRSFLDVTLQCATPEGIILLKLFALPSLYRQGQIERADLYETDILQLLRLDPVTDERLLRQLKPHLTDSDLKALGDVLNDLRGRLKNSGRFQNPQG
jgi:hypothetical protein